MNMKRLVALLLLVALLTGCGGVAPAPAPVEPASPPPAAGAVAEVDDAAGPETAGPTDAETQAGDTCLAGAPRPGESARLVTVRRAVDGDTLELTDGTRVRLIGINTPESVDPRRPVEYMGKEASAYTAELLTGKEILLEPGRQPVDRYGRTLAWIWLPDGLFVNALLVLEGYAQVATYADNPDHADLLLRCQREAQAAGRGLWAEAGGLAVLSAPGSVARGETASVTIQASPGITCSITVRYKSGPSKAKGLEPRQVGSDGRLTWSWTVGSSTTPGDWPVSIRCGTDSVETILSVH